jgi:DNA gyrase/topoisomerase IV subunit A
MGYAIRFGEDEVRFTSRFSKGVRALTLRKGDVIADIDLLSLDIAKVLDQNTTATGKERESSLCVPHQLCCCC